MAHARHEFALGGVGAFGHFLRFFQHRFGGHAFGDVARDQHGAGVARFVADESSARFDVQQVAVDVAGSEAVAGERAVLTEKESTQLRADVIAVLGHDEGE